MDDRKKEKLKKLIFFDTRDVFVLGGIYLCWFGLKDFKPWVANATCGFLLMLIGIFVGRNKKS